jgi:hypothetical protein
VKLIAVVESSNIDPKRVHEGANEKLSISQEALRIATLSRTCPNNRKSSFEPILLSLRLPMNDLRLLSEAEQVRKEADEEAHFDLTHKLQSPNKRNGKPRKKHS